MLADNNVEGKVDDSAQGRVRSALLAVGITTFLGLVFFLESQWTLSNSYILNLKSVSQYWLLG